MCVQRQQCGLFRIALNASVCLTILNCKPSPCYSLVHIFRPHLPKVLRTWQSEPDHVHHLEVHFARCLSQIEAQNGGNTDTFIAIAKTDHGHSSAINSEVCELNFPWQFSTYLDHHSYYQRVSRRVSNSTTCVKTVKKQSTATRSRNVYHFCTFSSPEPAKNKLQHVRNLVLPGRTLQN